MIGKLKIIAISDLHGFLPNITEPADIMLIAGDIIPLNIQFNKVKSKKWFETEFAYWIKSLPVDKVFMVAGNHDAYLEGIITSNKIALLEQTNGKLVYLENETTEYIDRNGLKWSIFGTPYCHIFGNWPFMRTEEYMAERFEEIPDKVDIIISHDPPFDRNDVDLILGYNPYHNYDHLGNKPLSQKIMDIDYKLLVCGHIHSGNHDLGINKCVNVSYIDEKYQEAYSPFYTEITQ